MFVNVIQLLYILPETVAWLSGFNPFNPHDASKHHFPSMKTNLIIYTWGLRGFQKCFNNIWQFLFLQFITQFR